ncbi:MAG: LD-carboxypeptidase [Clostridiales bacterium]|nr:LD-carboxypeptidase [Clostridiales bacterium]
MYNLSKGDSVGIVASSNGININMKDKLEYLFNKLENMGLNIILSKYIYMKYSEYNGTGIERAGEINRFFADKSIKVIFDISGGDLANEVLDYLDYKLIAENPKGFFGYSDLSVILNAINSKANIVTYNYQLRNLIGSFEKIQTTNFINTFFYNDGSLFNLDFQWIQGNEMAGKVVGGNIRCFLKLAGTKYMPDFNNKILLLESLNGNVAKIATALEQYKQIGAFSNINGIILGTFTEMERENYDINVVDLVKKAINNDNLPIVKTKSIGHGQDAKCIAIGKEIMVRKND